LDRRAATLLGQLAGDRVIRPRVGISISRARAEDGSLHPDVTPYVAAVVHFGGQAELFENDLARVDEQLGEVGGVILSGGADVAVELYGGRPLPQVQQPRPERDAFETALVRAAFERGIPVLAICRGLQIANVALGGTLIEDLPEELGDGYYLHHQQVKEDGEDRTTIVPEHVVSLASDSALARLTGATEFATNSMHHQAVRTVAPALRAVGNTGDGVIEALDARFEHPFFHAVQWHPEELLDDPITASLFGGLLKAIR
jgi:putative glutamine amidotransferase